MVTRPEISKSKRFNRARFSFLVLIALASCGSVFTHSHAAVVFTNVVSFDGTNGGYPASPLLQVGDGSFYGTSQGFFAPSRGTIFKLSPAGGFTNIGSFFQTNGDEPIGPLAQAGDGTIYGTTWYGGIANNGTIYKLPLNGNIETLVAFNGTNGSNPSGLILGLDNAFYGVTRSGGIAFNGQPTSGFGTIFRIDTNGVFETLFSFNGTNGWNPQWLILANDGMIYGTTSLGGDLYVSPTYISPTVGPGWGTVFKISGDGVVTTLFSFNGTNGFAPRRITQATDGALYGVTTGNSSTNTLIGGYGTVFRLTTNGIFTQLAAFNSQAYMPNWIVEAADGNLYGTTFDPSGSIFQLTPNGTLSFVYSFTDGANANYLTTAADGSVYGMSTGGVYSRGSIFRLTFLPDPPLLQSMSQAYGSFNFIWNANPGRSYQVQSAGDLGQAVWTNVGSPVIATNTMVSFSGNTNSAANCLYRVVLLP